MEHVHLVGISGTGLSAIARVLLERGVPVSGSDRHPTDLAEGLAKMGARIYTGHDPANIEGASLIVRSSAVPEENPEIQAAIKNGIPVLKRSEFLPLMLAQDEVIAIAGTHGKTTTTAMVAWMLKALGEDPSYIIGSTAHNLGSNAHAGQSRYFVIEADEYDSMFLGLAPTIAVITTVEHDHPDCFPTPEDFFNVFRQFIQRIKPQGKIIANLDDPGVQSLLAELDREDLSVFTYSLGDVEADCSASNLDSHPGAGYSFQFSCAGNLHADVALQVPGKFNVSNALAALSVACQLHLPLGRAAGALSSYRGTARRFQVIGETGGIILVDDYAHHPTEIEATIQAARTRYPDHPVWVVWQPHTYSRTRQLLDKFSQAFGDASHVLVTPVYAARETQPSDGFSGQDVANLINHPDVTYVPGLEEAARLLLDRVGPPAIILVLSAGNADQVTKWVLAALEQPEQENHA
jgi:UDP-N-acetylmuramate--alanine ligase